MDWARSTRRGKENGKAILVAKCERERPLGKRISRWKDGVNKAF
jgi:hypothetical protein